MKPIYLREIPNYCKKVFEKDMFYKRFGHLRVLGISDKTDSTNVHFCICICDCGRLFHTRKHSIQKGRTKSCCGYVSLKEEQERFKSKMTEDEGGCWITNGSTYKRPDGAASYGRFESKLFPNEYLAHRVSFLLFNGPIPENAYICHLCDIQPCANPDHLFLGDPKINALDREVKGRGSTGEKNHLSKYTGEIVLKARDLHSNGMYAAEVGRTLNIPKTTVTKFINRETWKHI